MQYHILIVFLPQVMMLVNQYRSTDDTAADILGVQVFDYT